MISLRKEQFNSTLEISPLPFNKLAVTCSFRKPTINCFPRYKASQLTNEQVFMDAVQVIPKDSSRRQQQIRNNNDCSQISKYCLPTSNQNNFLADTIRTFESCSWKIPRTSCSMLTLATKLIMRSTYVLYEFQY